MAGWYVVAILCVASLLLVLIATASCGAAWAARKEAAEDSSESIDRLDERIAGLRSRVATMQEIWSKAPSMLVFFFDDMIEHQTTLAELETRRNRLAARLGKEKGNG